MSDKGEVRRQMSDKKAKKKEPVLLGGLFSFGGERGIRTPVPVFADNMISNFSIKREIR